MLIFQISDLHIGKILHGYSMKEDQEYVLGSIIEKAALMNPQAVVLAGDIYDKSVPSAEAIGIFDNFLTNLSSALPNAAIMIVGGNHDGAERLEFAQNILDRQNIYIEGIPPRNESEYIRKVILKDEFGTVNFYLLPFVKPGYVRGVFEEMPRSYDEAVRMLIEREEIDDSLRNVIVTHQFYTASGKETLRSDSESITVGGIDNVDASVLGRFDYAAMGHVHRRQHVGSENAVYSGSILKYSISEQHQAKGFQAVTLGEKSNVSYEFVELLPLRQLREIRGTLEEVLSGILSNTTYCNISDTLRIQPICEDYVSIVLIDEMDLYRPKDRLEWVFKNILDIKLDNERVKGRIAEAEEESGFASPMEAFAQFFEYIQGRKLNTEEMEIVSEVIHEAKEIQEI